MLTEMNLSSENEINSDDKSNQINLKKTKKKLADWVHRFH